jgi:hypothetical protein
MREIVLVAEENNRKEAEMIENRKVIALSEKFNIDKDALKNISFEDWSRGYICVISKSRIEQMDSNDHIVHQYGEVSNNHYYFVKNEAIFNKDE